MNIIILGAAGFIGTNLTLALAKETDKYGNCVNHITVFDREGIDFSNITKNGFSNITIMNGNFDGDSDFENITRDQDIVYHLVSTTVPTTSNQQIARELTANVVVTANLLEACVKNGIKKVVFLSSGGTIYGKEKAMPLKEDTATYPISSYGIQKITIEKLLYLYRYLHGLDYRVIRLGNPYGPYQRPDGVLGVVTTFTYQALMGEPITVYGDGSVVRDFIYITDAIKGILNIVNGECNYRTFNLGCGYGTSIKEVIETIKEALNIEINVQYIPGRKVDVPVNVLDIGLYEESYGKLDSISLAEGIKKTEEFMRELYDVKYKNITTIAG
ncbi:MAG: NAD-dependent epimerase/dehydratase family protein [Eubacteriaceae bacterium]|nr:NAD-dependent epimerase/dehydratase family protein [Eubacteriaceae bacterium]